jgi:hypothetical protein
MRQDFPAARLWVDNGECLSHGSVMGLYDRDYMREKPEPDEADTPSPRSVSRRAMIITVGLVLLVALAVALLSK